MLKCKYENVKCKECKNVRNVSVKCKYMKCKVWKSDIVCSKM
jgi:hypothetical protein